MTDLLIAAANIIIGLVLLRVLLTLPGPRSEKLALSIFFLGYIAGVAHVALAPYYDLEPRENLERLDRIDADLRPGCSVLPRSPIITEDGSGGIACA